MYRTNFFHLIIVTFTLMVLGSPVMAQTIKYEDLYAKLPSLTSGQAYNQLFEYQKENPTFPNVYLQLGYACEQQLKGLDLLRDIEQANHWNNNAILFYNLFEFYFKEKDLRKNDKFYENLITSSKKKLSDADVMEYQKRKLQYCFSFRDTLTLIYNTLEQSKTYYNSCVQIFNEISTHHKTINETLLRADNKMLELLDSLNLQFVGSIETFKLYQELIRRFPIGSYNQQFTLKPIETFRLDGLTNSDFLDNNFSVWDYKTWISEFKSTYQSEIVPLRKEIDRIHEDFMKNREQIALLDTLTSDAVNRPFADEFLLQLEKYDINSIVSDLLEYLNGYQSLLISSRSELNSPTDSLSESVSRKYRYYYRLAQDHKQLRAKLNQLESAITPDRMLNHKAYFDEYYNGTEGFSQFISDERVLFDDLMHQNFSNLQVYLKNKSQAERENGYTEGAIQIPLYPQPAKPEKGELKPYASHGIAYAKGAPIYAGGYKLNGNRPAATIAKIGNRKTVEWIKEVGMPNIAEGDFVTRIQGFDEGCVAIVSAPTDLYYANTYVRLNAKGNIVQKKPLGVALFPCFMHFDEITQNSLLGFGEPAKGLEGIFNSIAISQLDSSVNILWGALIPVTGNLVDIIKADTKLLVFINSRPTSSNEPSALSISIIDASNGTLEKTVPIPLSQPYSIDRVVSISATEISLIGHLTHDPNSVVYMIADNTGEVSYCNIP